MSVLIKMEMPKSCPECPFNSRAWYEDSHRCLASNKKIKVNLNTGFDDNCPLAPIQPHGRLIDANALISGCKDEKGSYYGHESAIIGEAVESAPTVIDAED